MGVPGNASVVQSVLALELDIEASSQVHGVLAHDLLEGLLEEVGA